MYVKITVQRGAAGESSRSLLIQILYTNKRMKSLDESCYGYRRSRIALAPRIFDQGERQMEDDRRRQRISASHSASPQLPREKRLSGSQKLIAKLGEKKST
jgi:hypothetical protein